MKSAYEIAMSRLEKTAPTMKLNEKQKQDMAEIDSQYTAKIAERKVFLEGEIRKAQQTGSHEDMEQLRRQLVAEIAKLENEREEKKEQSRKSR
ncbi:MAG: hypothetical protein ABI615_10890 [Chthoniobacterales bacterium]